MDLISTLTGYGSLISLALCVAGFAVLYRAIRYPSIDCSAYLAFSQAMVSPVRMDRNFLVVFENDTPMYLHEKGVIFYSYNLTLNLLRLFRPKARMRGGQWLNLGFFCLFALTVFSYLDIAFEAMLPGGAILAALFFTLVLAAQVKLIATTAFIYSDILNFFLFGISLLLALAVDAAPTLTNTLMMGAFVGLCFRNRQSDLIILIAAILFLVSSGHLLLLPAACLTGFALINADLLYQQFVKGEPALDFLTSVIKCNVPHCKPDQPSARLVEAAMQGLRQMIDIRGGRSLFASAGVSMLLFPVSIAAVLVTGHFTGSAAYLVLCWLGFVAAMLVTRENASDSTALFHLRQAYILLVIMHLFNGLAFASFLARGWTIPCWGTRPAGLSGTRFRTPSTSRGCTRTPRHRSHTAWFSGITLQASSLLW